MFSNFYKGKRVFLTGHTGFKGSWLTEWLLLLGAEVHGFALDPRPQDLLFDQLRLSTRMASDTRGDVSDLNSLSRAVAAACPDVVFHLAAQPLVRLSYEIPIETFATNVMGTAHLLEAVRTNAKRRCAVLSITTDKCYHNREWFHAYREEDAMGGFDPYSASKGAAELIISSYRNSFFQVHSHVRLASARAGNVIGGGDWARDRIIPDCFRALRAGMPIPVRNKVATRPWQHVLEPLSGYLTLAATLATEANSGGAIASAFNFGPALSSNRTVGELVEELLKHTGGAWIDASDPHAPHEAFKLNLATDKAFHLLGWQPVWDFPDTIAHTAEWYLSVGNGECPATLTRMQITAYCTVASKKSLRWTA